MASQVVRDVIVRVTIQQPKTPLVIPGLRQVQTQLAQLATAPAKQIPKATAAVKKYAVEFTQLGDAAKNANQVIQQGNSAMSGAGLRSIRGFGNQVQNTSLAFARLNESSIRAGEAMRQGMTGAFSAMRGLAFLTASSEQELQKMLATVIKVAGAFELLRGGTDVLSGLQKGVRASRVAGIGLRAARRQGGAVAGGAVGGAAGAVGVSLGAKALGVLGTSVPSLIGSGVTGTLALGVGGKTVGGGLASLLTGTGLASGAGALGTGAAAVGGIAAGAALPIAAGVGLGVGAIAGPDLWRAYQSGRKLDKFRARSEGRLGVAGQLRGGAADALGASAGSVLSGLDSSSQLDDQLNSFGKMQAIQQRLKTIGQARARIQLEIMKSQEGGRRNIELETTARQAQKELSERALREARKLRDVFKQQNSERQKAIDKRKEELDAAKRLFNQEKDRVKGLTEFLGGKTRGELSSLKSAAQRIQQGRFSSTAKNLSDLESLGGPLVDQFVSSQRMARGVQAIAGSPSLSVFSGGRDIIGPNSQLAKMRQNVNDEQERIQELTQEMTDTTNEQNKMIINMLQSFVQQSMQFKGALAQIDRQVRTERLNRR